VYCKCKRALIFSWTTAGSSREIQFQQKSNPINPLVPSSPTLQQVFHLHNSSPNNARKECECILVVEMLCCHLFCYFYSLTSAILSFTARQSKFSANWWNDNRKYISSPTVAPKLRDTCLNVLLLPYRKIRLEKYKTQKASYFCLVLDQVFLQALWINMCKSNSTGAAKWFWPSIFAPFAEAGRRHSKD